MKAYSYIRFSSKRQITGHSLKRQHEACVQFCRDQDLTLDLTLSFPCGMETPKRTSKSTGSIRWLSISRVHLLTVIGNAFCCTAFSRTGCKFLNPRSKRQSGLTSANTSDWRKFRSPNRRSGKPTSSKHGPTPPHFLNVEVRQRDRASWLSLRTSRSKRV